MSPDDLRWLDHDHAARSVRRRWPDATGGELEARIDWALEFTPGRGKSRPQALRVNRRGAFVASERQCGRSLEQISDRLRELEGGTSAFSTRYLIRCQGCAAKVEARIDGAGWPKVSKRDIRRLLEARDRYEREQRRVLAINYELLVMAGHVGADEHADMSRVDRVRAFVDGSTPSPGWIATAFPDGDAKRKATELRRKRLQAVRARKRAAERFDARAAKLLPHLAHRPVIDHGTDLDRDAIELASGLREYTPRVVGDPVSTDVSPEDAAIENERKQTVKQTVESVLAQLPDIEREVISRRFGIGDVAEQSDSVAAEQLGLPIEQRERLERRGMERLREFPELASLLEAA